MARVVCVTYSGQAALLLAIVEVGDVALRSLAQEWLGDKPRLATVAYRERLGKLQRSRAVASQPVIPNSSASTMRRT